MPHLPQNLMAEGYSCLQRGQVIVAGEAAEAALPVERMISSSSLTNIKIVPPQRPQNLIPSANRDPQLAQATTRGVYAVPPALLPRLPPREGVNCSLDGALLNCA